MHDLTNVILERLLARLAGSIVGGKAVLFEKRTQCGILNGIGGHLEDLRLPAGEQLVLNCAVCAVEDGNVQMKTKVKVGSKDGFQRLIARLLLLVESQPVEPTATSIVASATRCSVMSVDRSRVLMNAGQEGVVFDETVLLLNLDDLVVVRRVVEPTECFCLGSGVFVDGIVSNLVSLLILVVVDVLVEQFARQVLLVRASKDVGRMVFHVGRGRQEQAVDDQIDDRLFRGHERFDVLLEIELLDQRQLTGRIDHDLSVRIVEKGLFELRAVRDQEKETHDRLDHFQLGESATADENGAAEFGRATGEEHQTFVAAVVQLVFFDFEVLALAEGRTNVRGKPAIDGCHHGRRETFGQSMHNALLDIVDEHETVGDDEVLRQPAINPHENVS